MQWLLACTLRMRSLECSTYPSLKVWVAGCATGEEAYSLAIVLAEERLLDRTLIYATDINPDCLRIAEEGIYDMDRFARFSEAYRLAGGRASLSDYYTARYSSAVLDRTLKKSILFSDHSLATDSAFAEVELVSCRNVLIYFERDLQDRALGVLRDSLCRKGFLGLGLKESLRFSQHAGAFTEFALEDRIYQSGMRAAMAVRAIEVIVVGGSAGSGGAGGHPACAAARLLDSGMALVLHMHRERPSRLPELLGAMCALPVREAEDKEPIAPATIYLAAPNYHLLIEKQRCFSLSVDPPMHFSRPAIDMLFRIGRRRVRLGSGGTPSRRNEDGARTRVHSRRAAA